MESTNILSDVLDLREGGRGGSDKLGPITTYLVGQLALDSVLRLTIGSRQQGSKDRGNSVQGLVGCSPAPRPSCLTFFYGPGR